MNIKRKEGAVVSGLYWVLHNDRTKELVLCKDGDVLERMVRDGDILEYQWAKVTKITRGKETA